MRKTIAGDLAVHQREAIKEALRVRKIIEDGLLKTITQDNLGVREETTRAVEALVENSRKVQSGYLKIKVSDDYEITQVEKRNMHVPLP